MTETQIMYKGKLITLQKLMEILKKEFSKHIGEENSVYINEILEKHIDEYKDFSIWKKYTYIDIFKKCISLLRRKGIIFIINRKGKYFVLKTQSEADYYKGILKKDIIAMHNSIEKADEWVSKEMWKKM